MIAPITENLPKEYTSKVNFCKLNMGENPRTAIRYQVMSSRLLLFFKNGQLVDSSIGAVSQNAIRPRMEALF